MPNQLNISRWISWKSIAVRLLPQCFMTCNVSWIAIECSEWNKRLLSALNKVDYSTWTLLNNLSRSWKIFQKKIYEFCEIIWSKFSRLQKFQWSTVERQVSSSYHERNWIDCISLHRSKSVIKFGSFSLSLFLRRSWCLLYYHRDY